MPPFQQFSQWSSVPLLIFEQLGTLPTPISFICVLQIGYSTFLINNFWGILVFQLGIFVNVKTLPTN